MPPFLCYFISRYRAIPDPGPKAHPRRTDGCGQGQLSGAKELFGKPWPALELLKKKLEEVLMLSLHEKLCYKDSSLPQEWVVSSCSKRHRQRKQVSYLVQHLLSSKLCFSFERPTNTG